MPENALNSIIVVENEIQAMLESERLRAQAWLERIRQEIETDLQRQLSALTATSAAAEQEARAAAADETAAVVRRAGQSAERLAEIGNGVLEQTVRRHLAVILQGESA
jgi:hypothetical protein